MSSSGQAVEAGDGEGAALGRACSGGRYPSSDLQQWLEGVSDPAHEIREFWSVGSAGSRSITSD